MELVSLDIERFGRVGRAQIAFKPGLNVLHGANEVGKSSIARAIRFALLLPSSSSAAEPWISWTGGGEPTVTLVFRNGADYYRVKKVFGTNTASLERSSDGTGWASLARSREVEARLRSLLQWGIPEPGGAKAPKGLPESFLASALLADQDQVASIFEQDLDSDGIDSGRVRVRAALQAMAQDPLFKAVLDAAQARVDEAFTQSGQRKRGALDPFKKMAEEVATRQRERDEAEQAATGGRLLAQRHTVLLRDAALAESDLQEQTAQRDALEQRRARQTAFTKAVEDRKKGQALVEGVTEAAQNVKAADDMLRDLEPSLPGLRKAEEDARKAFEAETAFASVAREKRKGALAQAEAAILAGARDASHGTDASRAGARSPQGGLLSAARWGDREDVESARRRDHDARGRGTLDRTPDRPDIARDRHSARSEDRRSSTKAGDLRSRAATEWPATSSNLLPDGKRLDEFRSLRHKLDMAEAKLDVGLSIEVRGAPAAKVSVDGAAKEAKKSPFAVEAKKSAELDLGGGIAVVVRGGQVAHRVEAERLRKEWHDTTASLLASVGVADFPELEEACRLDASKKARAETLTREAATAEVERAALGDPAVDRARLSLRILDLKARLQGTDASLIEADVKAHGSNVRAVLGKKIVDRDSQRSDLAQLRARESLYGTAWQRARMAR